MGTHSTNEYKAAWRAAHLEQARESNREHMRRTRERARVAVAVVADVELRAKRLVSASDGCDCESCLMALSRSLRRLRELRVGGLR